MKKSILLIPLFWVFIITLYSWQSPNNGNLYTMDDLCSLSDSINFNTETMQYEVRCNIIIMQTDTLKINPGNTVKFILSYEPWNKFGIKIYGCIQAKGTEEDMIILGDPEADFWSGESWNGIKFYNTSTDGESILKYCNIISAQDRFTYTAIYCENSSPIIDHTTISYMWADIETGGGSGIYCAGQSYPIVTYCTFDNLRNSVAVWCGNAWIDSLNINNWDNNNWGYQDTINYPSPLMVGCNIMPSVQSFWGYGCDYDKVVLNGGFLNNCYLGIDEQNADTSLGFPIDTIGDGICNTNSMNWPSPRYAMVDGIVNPRATPDLVGIQNEEINIPPTTSKYILLKKNYPNPFNPTTTIDFEIKKDNIPVSLEIYNSKGEPVKTLIKDKVYRKGKYSVVWNGDNKENKQVSSGVYFYKLSSNNRIQIKKTVLVK